MRYLATRNVQMVCRNDRGRQSLATVLNGHLAPVEVTAEDARVFIDRGFLREVTDEQAARILAGPTPPDLSLQVQQAVFGRF